MPKRDVMRLFWAGYLKSDLNHEDTKNTEGHTKGRPGVSSPVTAGTSH